MALTQLIKRVFYQHFFIIYENEWECLSNRDVIINRAKEYYENDKESLRVQARDEYGKLSEEEKNKKREYEINRYLNISEEKKQRLKEYQKNYREARKSQYNSE